MMYRTISTLALSALLAALAGATPALAETSATIAVKGDFRYTCLAGAPGQAMQLVVGNTWVPFIDSQGSYGLFDVKERSLDPNDPNYIVFRVNAASSRGTTVYLAGFAVYQATDSHLVKVNAANPLDSELVVFAGDPKRERRFAMRCTTKSPAELLAAEAPAASPRVSDGDSLKQLGAEAEAGVRNATRAPVYRPAL